jgi:hypothetical protein
MTVTPVTSTMNATYANASNVTIYSMPRLENGLGIGLWFIGVGIVAIYVFQLIMKKVRGTDDSGQGDDY